MIDEKKLIENLKESYGLWGLVGIDEILKIIKTQPKVGEWIPCSERLPEAEKEVLVYTEGYQQAVWSLIDQYDEYLWEDEFGGWNEFEEVIAWMPLPEPYKQ